MNVIEPADNTSLIEASEGIFRFLSPSPLLSLASLHRFLDPLSFDLSPIEIYRSSPRDFDRSRAIIEERFAFERERERERSRQRGKISRRLSTLLRHKEFLSYVNCSVDGDSLVSRSCDFGQLVTGTTCRHVSRSPLLGRREIAKLRLKETFGELLSLVIFFLYFSFFS